MLKSRSGIAILFIIFLGAALLTAYSCEMFQPEEKDETEKMLMLLESIPEVPDCEKNNTASVVFENRTTNKVYDVVWDGSKIDVLAAGEKSKTYTMAAGVQHTLDFKYSNTNTNACTQSTPTLAKCDSKIFWCTN